MKRPLGVIGLTYLLFLAVAFYFREFPVIIALCAVCAAAAAGGAVLRIFFRKDICNYTVAVGLSGLAALLSMFLYQNYHIQPVVNDYSDKEITVTGYISDEITYGKNVDEYMLTTETVDGEKKKLRIELWFYSDIPVKEFDRVEARLTPHALGAGTGETKGVYLCAYEDEGITIEPTGEQVNSIYRWAVEARIRMKRALDEILTRDASGICKAVLFGDKTSMSRTDAIDFNRTGTSFLIVVSGLHLSVVNAAFLIIIKRFKMRKLTVTASLPIIWCFTAIAGFPFSVLRAAITASILNIGVLINREDDPINSLGIAAILITAPNPCAAGNIGLLLSFTSLMGILLWAETISRFLNKLIHLNALSSDPNSAKGRNFREHIKALPKKITFRIICFITALVSASLAASVAVMPVLALLLGKITPLSFFVAVLTEPIASLLLILSLIISVLGCFPFLQFPAAAAGKAAELLCSWLRGINHAFSSIPIALVDADMPFIIITMCLIVVLTIVGLALCKKKRIFGIYVPAAIFSAVFVLCVGWAADLLLGAHEARLTIFQNGTGISVTASGDNALSLLSFSGSPNKLDDRISELYSLGKTIDCAVMPKKENSNIYLNKLCEDFEVKRIYLTDGADSGLASGAEEIIAVGEGESRKLRLNGETTDEIITAGKVMFQYITIRDVNVLYIPYSADIENLPEEYRTADVVLTESLPKHSELLSSDTLIFASNSEVRFNKYRDKLEEISKETIFLKNSSYEIK